MVLSLELKRVVAKLKVEACFVLNGLYPVRDLDMIKVPTYSTYLGTGLMAATLLCMTRLSQETFHRIGNLSRIQFFEPYYELISPKFTFAELKST